MESLLSSMPSLHASFVQSAIDVLKEDLRIVAICAGGSFLTVMDEWSDVDLVLVVNDTAFTTDRDARIELAGQLGDLVSVFTGEHVGEPRLLICLYGEEPLHVDLKFVTLDQLASRVEDPAILFARDDSVAEMLKTTEAVYPMPNLQWIEDRFWTWIHYGATKFGRGELFEARSTIEFLADRVFGPMILMSHGLRPVGMRRADFLNSAETARLRSLCVGYDRSAIKSALEEGVALYLSLRDRLASADLQRNVRAQRLVTAYLRRQSPSAS